MYSEVKYKQPLKVSEIPNVDIHLKFLIVTAFWKSMEAQGKI